jgi:hypothetical protein
MVLAISFWKAKKWFWLKDLVFLKLKEKLLFFKKLFLSIFSMISKLYKTLKSYKETIESMLSMYKVCPCVLILKLHVFQAFDDITSHRNLSVVQNFCEKLAFSWKGNGEIKNFKIKNSNEIKKHRKYNKACQKQGIFESEF